MNNTIIQKIYRAILLILFSLLTITQISFAAGSSPSNNVSAAEIRKKANIHFERALSFQKSGQYFEASEAYKKAVKVDSKYAQAWSNLGYSYRKQGYYKKAIKAYKKAIKLNPSLAEAHEYLGEAYAELGKFDLAEKELQILKSLGSDEADELEAFIKKRKAG